MRRLKALYKTNQSAVDANAFLLAIAGSTSALEAFGAGEVDKVEFGGEHLKLGQRRHDAAIGTRRTSAAAILGRGARLKNFDFHQNKTSDNLYAY